MSRILWPEMREVPIQMGESEARCRRALAIWRAIIEYPHLAWTLVKLASS